MGYKMIEITSEKQTELAEHAEKVLKHAGKLMQCIEDMCDEEDEEYMGERGGYGRRGGYMGNRMGRRGGMGRRVYPSKGGYPTYDGGMEKEDWDY